METQFGLDFDELEHGARPIVAGRVLHIDGDFIAYHSAHDDEELYENMVLSADTQVNTLKLASGAEEVCVHLTPRGSDKGKRYKLAIQQPYQGNREGRESPKHLEKIRRHLASTFPSKLWLDREADDGLAKANWEAFNKDPELSVIVSKDKDLRMCVGYQMDWDTHELTFVDDFGTLFKHNRTILGYGKKFFWAQMLMGDTTDSITGLPWLHRDYANKYVPTKAVEEARANLNAGTGNLDRWQKVLDDRPHLRCGAMTALKLLDDIDNNASAFRLVADLYKAMDGEYVHYATGENIPWNDVFLSEAMLLWMRRGDETDDVIRYLTSEI